MSSNEDNKNENEDADDTMSQNKKNKRFKLYFRWNSWESKIIWRANKIVKKVRRSKRALPLSRFWC